MSKRRRPRDDLALAGSRRFQTKNHAERECAYDQDGPDIEPSLSVLLKMCGARGAAASVLGEDSNAGSRVNVADAGGPPVRGGSARGGKK